MLRLARSPRSPTLPGVLTIATLAGLAILVTGCGSTHQRPVPSAATRPTLVTIFEDDPQLRIDPAATLDDLRRLGANVVKVYVPWEQVAPDPTSRSAPSFDAADPAAYPAASWTYFDTVVRDAAARGIGVDMTVGAPVPQWATGSGEPAGGLPGVWKPSAAAFGQFVRALGKRYSGSYTPPGSSSPLPAIKFWSIWNEPNYGPDLAPQATDHSTVEVSPFLYRQLVGAAWTALGVSGHGADTILIGEIAPRGITTGDNPGSFSGMVPLRFVRALYCLGPSLQRLTGAAATARGCPAAGDPSRFVAQNPGLFHASGFAVHPYPQGNVPPNVVTPGEPDFADLAALPRLEQLLDNAQRAYGSSKRFDLYSTEFGYKTNPPFIAGAPLAQAARYLNWAEYLSWRDPRIRSYDQYLLEDPPPGDSQFDTGLEFSNGSPKPSLPAFRLPIFLPATHGSRGQPLLVWGCARPARFAHGAQRVRIELRSGRNGSFKVVQTVSIQDPNGYFVANVRFPSSGTVRLAWSYPDGATIHSREIAVTIT